MQLTAEALAELTAATMAKAYAEQHLVSLMKALGLDPSKSYNVKPDGTVEEE